MLERYNLDRQTDRQTDRQILWFCLFAIFLEVVVCNFRTWESISWKSYDLIENDSFSLKDGQYKSLDKPESVNIASNI